MTDADTVRGFLDNPTQWDRLPNAKAALDRLVAERDAAIASVRAWEQRQVRPQEIIDRLEAAEAERVRLVAERDEALDRELRNRLLLNEADARAALEAAERDRLREALEDELRDGGASRTQATDPARHHRRR